MAPRSVDMKGVYCISREDVDENRDSFLALKPDVQEDAKSLLAETSCDYVEVIVASRSVIPVWVYDSDYEES